MQRCYKAWRANFIKKAILRTLVKKIGKMEEEWERTRFKREFNYMSDAFNIWKIRLQERQALL